MAHSGEACVATAAPHDRSCSCKGHRGAEADRVDCVRIAPKTANVLNKVPRSVQRTMKADLREIHGAPTRAAAETAMDVFAEKYGAKYARAAECLTKDRDALLAFYDLPAEHWDHLRTTNPIESVFATVRHRTVRTKGALSPTTARLMVFKLIMAAAKGWRRLKGETQLPKVVAGVTFQDGTEVIVRPANHAA
jgi:putative transposase